MSHPTRRKLQRHVWVGQSIVLREQTTQSRVFGTPDQRCPDLHYTPEIPTPRIVKCSNQNIPHTPEIPTPRVGNPRRVQTTVWLWHLNPIIQYPNPKPSPQDPLTYPTISTYLVIQCQNPIYKYINIVTQGTSRPDTWRSKPQIYIIKV